MPSPFGLASELLFMRQSPSSDDSEQDGAPSGCYQEPGGWRAGSSSADGCVYLGQGREAGSLRGTRSRGGCQPQATLGSRGSVSYRMVLLADGGVLVLSSACPSRACSHGSENIYVFNSLLVASLTCTGQHLSRVPPPSALSPPGLLPPPTPRGRSPSSPLGPPRPSATCARPLSALPSSLPPPPLLCSNHTGLRAVPPTH